MEVDINGEHTFILSKRRLTSYSGRLKKHFGRSDNRRRSPKHEKIVKVELHDFPGGPAAFELAAKFCYKGGDTRMIKPTNIALLRAAAQELEMTEEYAQGNLERRTEEFLAASDAWDWQDLLAGLMGCSQIIHSAESLRVVQRLANAVANRISTSFLSSSPASPEQSESLGPSPPPSPASRNWWFSDVAQLPLYLLERVVKALFTYNMDHRYLSRFLLFYLKRSLTCLGYNTWVLPQPSRLQSSGNSDRNAGEADHSRRMQLEVLETVVSLLSQLVQRSISFVSLFTILRIAAGLKSSKLCRTQIERMIGLQLDKATLDDILVPSSAGRTSSGCSVGSAIYDVDLVQRLTWYFVKSYVSDDFCSLGPDPLLKVGRLMDSYLSEIAPDPHLHSKMFLRLAKCLPSTARLTDEHLYVAVDIYLEAHPHIRNTERTCLCEVVNYQKLSNRSLIHLSQNPRFPTPVAMRALMAQRALRKSISETEAEEFRRNLDANNGGYASGSNMDVIAGDDGDVESGARSYHSSNKGDASCHSGDASVNNGEVRSHHSGNKGSVKSSQYGNSRDIRSSHGDMRSSHSVNNGDMRSSYSGSSGEIMSEGDDGSSDYRRFLAQNERLKLGILQMQSKVDHLEQLCKNMRPEVVDIVRTKRMIC